MAVGRRRDIWTNRSWKNRVQSAQLGDSWEQTFWDHILEVVVEWSVCAVAGRWLWASPVLLYCAGGILKQEKYFAFSYSRNKKESGGEATLSSKGQGGVLPSEMGSCTGPFVLWESIMLWMHISSSFGFGWPMSGCHCGHLEWASWVLVCILWSCTTARFCLS